MGKSEWAHETCVSDGVQKDHLLKKEKEKKEIKSRAHSVQSSGAVWKSRWPSWAPVPNKPTVSADVKQHHQPRSQSFYCGSCSFNLVQSHHKFGLGRIVPLIFLWTVSKHPFRWNWKLAVHFSQSTDATLHLLWCLCSVLHRRIARRIKFYGLLLFVGSVRNALFSRQDLRCGEEGGFIPREWRGNFVELLHLVHRRGRSLTFWSQTVRFMARVLGPRALVNSSSRAVPKEHCLSQTTWFCL